MQRWLVPLATAGMIFVNGLANGLPINGKTTGDISNGFDILFTPAGYVFSIWGLIYLGVTAFAIFQALPSRAQSPLVVAMRPWVLLNATANAAWIFAWHHLRFGLSWLLMLVILASLVMMRREMLARPVEGSGERWCVRAPYRLYLGWISVATIANTTVLAWDWGIRGPFMDTLWTMLIIGLAAAICVWVGLRTRDAIYAGVFAWASVGISVANADLPLLRMGALVAAGLCAAVGVAAVMLARRGATPVTGS